MKYNQYLPTRATTSLNFISFINLQTARRGEAGGRWLDRLQVVGGSGWYRDRSPNPNHWIKWKTSMNSQNKTVILQTIQILNYSNLTTTTACSYSKIKPGRPQSTINTTRHPPTVRLTDHAFTKLNWQPPKRQVLLDCDSTVPSLVHQALHPSHTTTMTYDETTFKKGLYRSKKILKNISDTIPKLINRDSSIIPKFRHWLTRHHNDKAAWNPSVFSNNSRWRVIQKTLKP